MEVETSTTQLQELAEDNEVCWEATKYEQQHLAYDSKFKVKVSR